MHILSSRVGRGAVGVVLALLIAEAVTLAGIVSSQFLPPMHVILATVFKICTEADFLLAVANTTLYWLVGLAISIVLGIVLGFWTHYSTIFKDATQGLFDLLRPIPSVILVPLGIVSIGQGDTLKVLLVIYAAVWPVLFNTTTGLRQLEALQINTARVFHIPRRRQLADIVWHNVTPYIITGIRIASPLALMLAISVELLSGSTTGIGAWILSASTGSGRPDLVFAGTFIAGLLGVAANVGFVRLEHHLLHWHVAYRSNS